MNFKEAMAIIDEKVWLQNSYYEGFVYRMKDNRLFCCTKNKLKYENIPWTSAGLTRDEIEAQWSTIEDKSCN